MTSQALEGACAFAWRNYLLLHSGLSENDDRRAALHRYMTQLSNSGEYDFGNLQVAGVAYLKNWTNCTTTEMQDLQQIKR